MENSTLAKARRGPRERRRGSVVALVLAGLTAGFSPTAAASDASVAKLAYRAYYGGLSAVEIQATITVSNQGYEVASVGHSIGFLDYLFPFQSRANGSGSFGNALESAEFSLESMYRGRSRQIRGLTKANGAPDWSVKPPIPLDERDPVPLRLRAESLDPVAAQVAAAVRQSARETCGGTSRIFNGKVRTDIHLSHLGSETLVPTRFSDFSGPTEKCRARYETLAGGYKKSWFGEDSPPPDIDFWITRLEGSNFWIPVRVEADIKPVKVLVHLTSATVDAENLIKSP